MTTDERFGNDWFAVQARAGREHLSAAHLRARGYDVLMPSYYEVRQWSDRVKKVQRALFPGYLFCRLTEDTLSKVVTAPGVIRIIGNSDGPIPVDAAEMATLRRVIDTSLAVEPFPFVREGDVVAVVDGPLCGAQGVVLRSKGRHRLIVSISLLHRSIAVEIDSRWVVLPFEHLCAQAAADPAPTREFSRRPR